jgi:hypothetical protein
MKLLRIVTMHFSPAPEGWSSWEIRLGDVTVSTIPVGKSPPSQGKLRLLVRAEIGIQFPEVDGEGYVNLPEKERRQCEAALENISDIIAVFGRCSRSISSASPCAALVTDELDERKRLDATRGIRSQRSAISRGHHFQIPVSRDLISGLQDRRVGAALLAEALSHQRESGRYREFVRFFESAFALPFSQIEKKLVQFLNPVFGYTRREIAEWIQMRHPLTHADGKKTDYILVDADFRKISHRMEQAALDVLFNKVDWHNSSRSRRNLWIPIAATTSCEGNSLMRQGSQLTSKFQFLDDFNIFPMDLEAFIQTPPDSWWCKFGGMDPEGQSD